MTSQHNAKAVSTSYARKLASDSATALQVSALYSPDFGELSRVAKERRRGLSLPETRPRTPWGRNAHTTVSPWRKRADFWLRSASGLPVPVL